MRRREQGRNASYYVHPLGRRADDIILHYEQGRPDKTVNLMDFSSYHSGGSIIASYGGEEEYYKAMDRIWKPIGMYEYNVYHESCLSGVRISATGTYGYEKMQSNYQKVLKDMSLYSAWVPVFWYNSPNEPMCVKVFMTNMLRFLGVDSIDSNNICMYMGRRAYETKIYMRKDFLQNSSWGRNQINIFRMMNKEYIVNHKL